MQNKHAIDGLPADDYLWAIKVIDRFYLDKDENGYIFIKLIKLNSVTDFRSYFEEKESKTIHVAARMLPLLRVGQVFQNMTYLSDLPTINKKIKFHCADLTKVTTPITLFRPEQSITPYFIAPIISWLNKILRMQTLLNIKDELQLENSNYLAFDDSITESKYLFPASLLIQTFYTPSSDLVSAILEMSWNGGGLEKIIEYVDSNDQLTIKGSVSPNLIPLIALLAITKEGRYGASYIWTSILQSFREDKSKGYGVLDCILPYESDFKVVANVKVIEIPSDLQKTFLVTDINSASWPSKLIDSIEWKRPIQSEFSKNEGYFNPHRKTKYRNKCKLKNLNDANLSDEVPNAGLGEKEVIGSDVFSWLEPPEVKEIEVPNKTLIKKSKLITLLKEKNNISLKKSGYGKSDSIAGEASPVKPPDKPSPKVFKSNEFDNLLNMIKYFEESKKIISYSELNYPGITEKRGTYYVLPVKQLDTNEKQKRLKHRNWHLSHKDKDKDKNIARVIYPIEISMSERKFIWFEIEKLTSTYKYLIIEITKFKKPEIQQLLVRVSNYATTHHGIWQNTPLEQQYNRILIKHYGTKIPKKGTEEYELDYDKIYKLGLESIINKYTPI